jgi:hypothetical protein
MKRDSRPQDITWFLDINRAGQLNLDPPYQRKSVWTPKDQKSFLDTIFRNYPCPAIFLHKEISEGKTIYNVVDGKQRLQTILNFVEDKTPLGTEFNDQRLDGKRWSELTNEQKKALWDYIIPVEMIDISDPSALNEAFARLNRNARKLERQELRHSQYDGWFIGYAEREALDEDWKRLKVSSTTQARRMRDIQFLAELLLVVIEHKIHGFDQDMLDAKHAEYNDLTEVALLQEEDAIMERFTAAKKFIVAMEDELGVISDYASTNTHFYTLWAWVVLRRAVSAKADEVANSYKEFMEQVKKLTREEVDQAGAAAESVTYFNNSRGASTDLTQRQSRLDALTAALPK